MSKGGMLRSRWCSAVADGAGFIAHVGLQDGEGVQEAGVRYHHGHRDLQQPCKSLISLATTCHVSTNCFHLDHGHLQQLITYF